MKCDICKEEIPKENIEEYSRGRWIRICFHCNKCGNKGIKKLSLIADITTTSIKAKGCTVPWGKSKTHRGSWER